MEDFALLVSDGNLGFYNSCEVISVFLLDDAKLSYNLFTIFIFEECAKFNENKCFLTPKLITVNKEYSLGICKKQLTIAQIP